MFALTILATSLVCLLGYLGYLLWAYNLRHPLRAIAGPPLRGFFEMQLGPVLTPAVSPKVHEYYVQRYGRSIRLQGIGPFDQRLLTLDPVSIAHVLKHSTVYEKPWQSRRLITSMIGCGLLAAEGAIHKRQRRVATPAFSVQNLRALVPLVFKKGNQLNNRWSQLIRESSSDRLTLDVCHWINRATFDVIGIAGFDYDFNAIQDESNQLFLAYREMFEVAISQGDSLRNVIRIYAPFLDYIIPDKVYHTIQRCQKVIHSVAGQLVQDKKAKIIKGQVEGIPYDGRDLLSLLIKSNMSTDILPEHRISDEDLLHNVNTFMFAGSDTSSLTLTWTLFLLAKNPSVQDRLRLELLSARPSTPPGNLSEEEIQSLFAVIADLPYLHNVVRESIRFIPALHSSIRVATQDDEIPTSYPIHGPDGTISSRSSVPIPKGCFVHVAVEGFNLDREFWGENAWEFQPDRWDNLADVAANLPGLFSNTLTFSAGPRSCIGMKFSMIEMKTFLYILLTNFVFHPTEATIIKANVVLTRPYVKGKYKEGSQLPLMITPYMA